MSCWPEGMRTALALTSIQSPFRMPKHLFLLSCVLSLLVASATILRADPLPSWNDTAARQAIVTFVEKVTKEGSPDFVPVPERIATFDNDGTLWAEQPMYFQLLFAMDRVEDRSRRLDARRRRGK